MLDIQDPQDGKLHPFPMKKDGEGKSVLPLLEWSPSTPWHRPKWEGELFSAGGVPCDCKSDTAARPETLLESLWLLLKLSLSIFWRQNCTVQGRRCRTSHARKSQAHLSCEAMSKHFGQEMSISHSPQHLCCFWRQTSLPNKPLLPPFSPFWIWVLHSVTASPKNHLFPLPGKAQKNVCSTVCELGWWRPCTPTTDRTKNLTVLAQLLSKAALWLSPAHSSIWAPLFSLTPTRHEMSQGFSGRASLTSFWNFYFIMQSAYGTGKTGTLRNTYWIFFGHVLSSSGMDNSHNTDYCQIPIL